MSVSIDHYKEMLAQPWGKIQYELTFYHLRHITNKKSPRLWCRLWLDQPTSRKAQSGHGCRA